MMCGRGLLRRAVVVALLSVVGVLGAAGPAFAHSVLLGSNPADGANLDTGPSQVALTFNEDMPPGFDVVFVIGPDGKQWQDGQVTTSGPVVSVPVAPLGPAGRYQVGYRVVSGDGHPVEGRTSFTLSKAGPGSAPPQTSAPGPDATAAAGAGSGGGLAIWPWILGAAVLIGAGVVAVLRLGRS
jgi:methionine-rich copper-binding protein CopC